MLIRCDRARKHDKWARTEITTACFSIAYPNTLVMQMQQHYKYKQQNGLGTISFERPTNHDHSNNNNTDNNYQNNGNGGIYNYYYNA